LIKLDAELQPRRSIMKRLAPAAVTLTVALAALTMALPAGADEHRDGGRHEESRGHEGGQWHGGIEHFHERDYHVWRQGHWEHRWHDGRYGWWWFAAGLWYFYPAPIYPYPDPYQPPVVVVPPAAAAAPVAPAGPPPPQYWYYCDSPGGYYPYVPTCPSGWRAVPASPAR
jgi:hypothetical protein